MKLVMTVFAALVFSNVAYCQQMSTEEMIRRMVESGISEGQMQKHIAGIGDAAAVYVTKVLAEKRPNNSEIESALAVFYNAFGGEVSNVADRQPRTTFFVLQYFDLCATDPRVKQRIAETQKYVLDQVAKYKTKNSQTK